MRSLEEYDIDGHKVFYLYHEYEWYMTFEEMEYPNWPESFDAKKKMIDDGRTPRMATGFHGFLYRQEQMLIDWTIWDGDPTKWNDEYRMRSAFERYLFATQQPGVYSRVDMPLFNRSIEVMKLKSPFNNSDDIYKRQNNSKWFSQEHTIQHNHLDYHHDYKFNWFKAGTK